MIENRQFTPVYLDFIDSKAFDKLSGNALKLYLRMRRYVCRARSGHSLCDFYIKGLLAVSGYLSQYADAFGVHKSSISRWLKELEEAKFIVTYHRAEKGMNEPNIWILGRIIHLEGSKYGLDAFFADHDAMAQERDERAAQIFDQSRGECIFAQMRETHKFADLLTVASMQRSVQHPVAQVQPSNIEDQIYKSNTLPPKKRAEEDPPSVKAEVEYIDYDEEGFPSKPKHPLITYLAQHGRKLTDNQQAKLARGVPYHNPEYPSPCTLFERDPLFQVWIDDKIAWATGGKDGKRKQTQSLVNAIRNYDEEHYGWFNFKQGETEAKQAAPVPKFKQPDQPSQEDIDWYYKTHGKEEDDV